MNRNGRDAFWRAVLLSSVVLFCLIFGLYSAGKAYENTLQIGYGIYRTAIEQRDGHWCFFDFELPF